MRTPVPSSSTQHQTHVSQVKNTAFATQVSQLDSRDEAAQLARMQGLMADSAQSQRQRSLQAKMQNGVTGAESAPVNKTGLPDQLKNGVESLSGMSLDHVKVHYNSDKPAQLNAHAYAQGSEIHVAPGQEQHLPHEAWHVVQQAQGRVRPTMQMKAGVSVNDDAGLEHEADVMGMKALQVKADHVEPQRLSSPSIVSGTPLQGFFRLNAEEVAERVVGDELGGHRFIVQEVGSDEQNPQSFTNSDHQVNLVRRETIPPLRVSNDGRMAMEDCDLLGSQAKVMYVSPGLIAESNEMLASTHSQFILSRAGGTLRVPNREGAMSDLVRVVAARAASPETQRGRDLTGPVRCNEMAAQVTGQADSSMDAKLGSGTSMKMGDDFGNRMASYITAYSDSLEQSRVHNQTAFFKRGQKKISSRAKEAAETASGFEYQVEDVVRQVPSRVIHVAQTNIGRFEAIKKAKETQLNFRWTNQVDIEGQKYQKFFALLIGEDPETEADLLTAEPFAGIVERISVGANQSYNERRTNLQSKQTQIADDYGNLDAHQMNVAEQRLGVNDYASPDVGEAYMITSAGPVVGGQIHDVRKDTDMVASFPYHWGGVIAKSGSDTVTLENYARKDEDGTKPDTGAEDGRAYFQMYGAPSHLEAGSESFHEVWSRFFANPVTAAFKNTEKEDT